MGSGRRCSLGSRVVVVAAAEALVAGGDDVKCSLVGLGFRV